MAEIDYDRIKREQVIDSVVRDFSERERALYVLDELKKDPELMMSERGRALIKECKKVLGEVPDIWSQETEEEFEARMWKQIRSYKKGEESA